MPKISIAVANSIKSTAAVKFLHKDLGWALTSASKMLFMGRTGVFYTCQLYMNDHQYHDKKIRSIISFFNSEKINLRIIEIDDSEDWGNIDMQHSDNLVLTEEELINALDAAKGRYH